MSLLRRFSIIALASLIPLATHAASSDWSFTQQPEFPPSALRKSVEGSVKFRLLISKDGHVVNAVTMKSSGDSSLDGAARNSVLKWSMKPSAVRPGDMTRGRVEEVVFRQEAIRSATYPLGVAAGFGDEAEWKQLLHAPFPYYPMDARRLRHSGIVVLSATIGPNGWVTAVRIDKSSGFNDLDELAAKAVRHWRAHKEFAGHVLRIPVNFTLTRA